METKQVEILFHGKVIQISPCVATSVSGGWTLFFEPPMRFPQEGLYTFQCPDGRSGEFYVSPATLREASAGGRTFAVKPGPNEFSPAADTIVLD
jgi:hypothetical protein